jgi:membrane protease YdiL (CAAX protease family)
MSISVTAHQPAPVVSFIRQHPLVSYFALTFTLSWGGVLMVLGGDIVPVPGDRATLLFPRVYLAMLTGPSIAGVLLTALVHGRGGLRAYATRLGTWRVGARWYGVALLTAPILATATLYGLSLWSDEFLPRFATDAKPAALLAFGVAVGLGAGFFEELGWTGFVVPELRARQSALATGITVGLMWGAWHVLVNVWGSGTADGAFSPALLGVSLLFSVGILPAWRLLMVRVHDRTDSTLIGMLMHASLTATAVVIMPLAAPSATILIWYLVFLAELVLIYAIAARRAVVMQTSS